MTDIKPDTSLYTDLPSRLRAMALVLEGPRERVQVKSPFGWKESCGGMSSKDRVRAMTADGYEYRLKPAPPAKLYADIADNGRLAHAYDDPRVPMPGITRVTYVLENSDAND